MQTEENCSKCGLQYTHQLGCSNSQTPTYENKQRMAVCSYGDSQVPSDPNLAYFRARPELETDEYYCGCFGWD